MESRLSVAVGVGALTTLVVLGGCLSGGVGGSEPTTTATKTATATPVASPRATAAPTDGTATSSTWTPGGHGTAERRPDADKTVTLRNEWNRTVEMRVRVVREATDETVHDGRYELAPGAERDVYTTARADPDGVERFTVVLTARNTTERVGIETSTCYGNAYGTVQADGTVYLYYEIC